MYILVTRVYLGEHIHTWRPRYFVLYADGTLVGYKAKPTTANDWINIFSVKGRYASCAHRTQFKQLFRVPDHQEEFLWEAGVHAEVSWY